MPPLPDVEQQKLWGRAYADALRFALYLTHDQSHAEELAADALAAALDPDRSPWRPDGDLTLSQHVVRLVRGLFKDEASKKGRRGDPVVVATLRETMHASMPRPDARIHAMEHQSHGAARMAEVRAQLDPLAQRVLDLFGEGLTRKEQALKLGVDVREVYRACERIAARVRGLPRAGPDGEPHDDDSREGDGQIGSDTLDGEPQEDEEDEVSP
jgi:DNA-directed RNA polymerase specialized sigma24 family protein